VGKVFERLINGRAKQVRRPGKKDQGYESWELGKNVTIGKGKGNTREP